MALENQINLYSVDTGNFYTKKERLLHNKNVKIRNEKKSIIEKTSPLKKQLEKAGYTKEKLQELLYGNPVDIIPGSENILYEYTRLCNLRRSKTRATGKIKKNLSKLLSNKIRQKESVNTNKKHNYIYPARILDTNTISDKNIISVFESSLTRMIGLKKDDFTEDIIIIQVYYFDIFKDIVFYGFMYKNEKYRYYTSSAGQIRKKKAVFIKESVWDKYEKTIMCGLTIGKINEKGGNNVNKHLAYMALTNSATDEWTGFDIDRTIVINDFETNVSGEYDLIDDSDYSITRVNGEVPVTHTDGAGMVLSGKNRMFRAPWIKGLLGVFNFKDIILEWREKYNDNSVGVIEDIYGEKHDIIAEDIYIIFTKSQFKMYKYYESWDEYKEYFKKYNCKAGVCNTEEEKIPDSRLNYQELQTLTEMTESELAGIAMPSINKLNNLCSSVSDMQTAFGITPYNTNMTPLQKAVKIYPDIMNDAYFKDIIKNIKDSMVKKYKSAKLEVEGKYTFLLPDFYAACEYWFLDIKNPAGLLKNNEVWCSLFRQHKELDCLRSPHLYKEHAIRENAANTGTDEEKELMSKWFNTQAVYTSCHDLISKILQFDVDGDHSLVIGDDKIIEIAKKSMQGVVPLYYNMRKAEPEELNNINIYNGLNAAFTGSNIGIYSNNITKIWNSDIFINGSGEDKKKAADIVKLLCMENNFCIDYAKTLYKPKRPEKINGIIKNFTDKKVPYFFIYAKGKEVSQVEKINNSIINRLDSLIPNPRINTRKMGLKPIEYKYLMHNTSIRVDSRLIEKYTKLNNTYHFKISMKDEYQNNLRYLACKIRNELSISGYSEIEICDMLVKYLYEKKNRKMKELLWFCYGKYIVRNLKKNYPVKKTRTIQCINCGGWFEVDMNNAKTCRCKNCSVLHKRELRRLQTQRYRKNKQCSS